MAEPADAWNLGPYVAGQTPKSLPAFANIKQLCETHLAGIYRIEVVDLLERPDLARRDQVVAISMLIREFPSPARGLLGRLHNLPGTLRRLGTRTR
jgi:circadian clock protein KaiB